MSGPLTIVEYVMYFVFVDGRMFSHNGPYGIGNIDVRTILDAK